MHSRERLEGQPGESGSTAEDVETGAEGARPEPTPSDGVTRYAGVASDLYRRWSAPFSRFAGLDSLLLCLAGFALAAIGQHVLTPGDRPDPNADITAATRWYLPGTWLVIVGFWGTYTNRSLLRRPLRFAGALHGWWIPGISELRLVLIACAVLWNVLALLTLRADWTSGRGALLWVVSLVFLVLACLRERVVVGDDDAPPETDRWTLPRWAEIVIFAAILVLAFTMRVWRLGDLSPGMHGDEGEAGSDALGILNGQPAPLFARGWFNQPNLYYWTIAVFMKIFGTNLVGLRSFVVLCGMATVIFTYLLGREMFGQRGGIVAGAFMAFGSADLLFSRQEFSNATTPALFAMAFYFVVRGLRTRRHLDFVLAGFASGFALYFFAGGRLVGPVILLFFGYLAVFHRPFVKPYWTHVVAFLAALAGMAMPFVGYYIAYPIIGLQYPNDRFIWLHHADLAVKYGSADWKVIVWRQFQATISILTQSSDVSAMGALSYPIARPIEAVPIVIGLVWAAWRWLDTRFFLLSLWFWAAVIFGGVLTLDAPNLPRIMAMLPVLPLLIAAVLDALAALLARVVVQIPPRLPVARYGTWAGAVALAVVTVIAGVENWHMYIGYYLNTHQNPVVTGQAQYVQQGGTKYRYYGMGAPIVYWTHGDNRFINANADGIDAGDVSTYLPLIDNGPTGEKPANFLLWPPTYDYLSVLKTYYPAGTARTVPLGDPENLTDPLVGYVVPRAEIDRHRVLQARYHDASGRVVTRAETAVGFAAGSGPPPGLRYPVRATWDGDLVAPQYDVYQLQLSGPVGTSLTVDGVRVLAVHRGPATRAVVLARGAHVIHLEGVLRSARAPMAVLWSRPGTSLGPIPRTFLWDGHTGQGWIGEVQSAGVPAGVAPLPHPDWRVDGFLGVRNGAQGYGSGPLLGHWSSVLTVRKAGQYDFQINATGEATFRIDRRVVVFDTVPSSAPQTAHGSVYLGPGQHALDVAVNWPGPVDILECWWAPPRRQLQIFESPDLRPNRPGVWIENAIPTAGAQGGAS